MYIFLLAWPNILNLAVKSTIFVQCRNEKSDAPPQPSTICLTFLQMFLGRKVHISCHDYGLFVFGG